MTMPISEPGDPCYAPGTVRLETADRNNEIVLHPSPTDDPNDPLNWAKWRKALNFTLASTFVTLTFVVVDNIYVLYAPYAEDLGASQADINNSLAVQYAGLAFGSIFFLPFTYRYGRRPVYLASTSIQLIATIWTACMTTRAELYVTNLLQGLSGAVSESIVMITITDLFFVHQHALLNGIFLFMQSIGAYLGPVAMGYVVAPLGWRWVWWITAILLGVNLIFVLFAFEETKYTPQILGESSRMDPADPQDGSDPKSPKTQKLITVSSNVATLHRPKSYRERLALTTMTEEPILPHFYQPILILFKIPGVAYAAITYGLLLAWTSSISSSQSYYTIFPPYNLGADQIGLLSLPPFIGLAIGTIIFAPLSDWLIVWLSKRNSGIFEPEMRLWLAPSGAALSIGGLLMFGLCLANKQPLMLLNVGAAIFCVGFVVSANAALTYLIDCYENILGDAMVAVVLLRNGFSVIIMFAYTPWITNMGIRNTHILMAVLGFVVLNIPIAFLIWGKKWRIATSKHYLHYSQEQMTNRHA
ncbi:hypothetical protein ACHAPJ_009767 [Fusarium lateritium]